MIMHKPYTQLTPDSYTDPSTSNSFIEHTSCTCETKTMCVFLPKEKSSGIFFPFGILTAMTKMKITEDMSDVVHNN